MLVYLLTLRLSINQVSVIHFYQAKALKTKFTSTTNWTKHCIHVVTV